MIPESLRYTKEHEWARREDGTVTVGITHYAQDQLGDVVFVELPQVGQKLEAGQSCGVVEAVKTVSDLFAPVSGEVVEVNQALTSEPALVNRAPYEDGWMIRVRAANPDDFERLLGAGEYEALLEGLHA